MSRIPARETEAWPAAPIARTNVAALSTTAAVMLFLASYRPEDIAAVDHLRASAAVLIAAHAALHVLTLHGLKILEMLEVAEATPALARYRDPRRVSHCDLAAAWLGYYALVPYIAAAA